MMNRLQRFPAFVALILLAFVLGCGAEHGASSAGADPTHDHGQHVQGDHAEMDHSAMDGEGMGDEEMEDGGHSGHDHAAMPRAASDAQTWTCSMHPQVQHDAPGQCPICGMDLVRANASSGGDGVVRIDPATVQSMGVSTTIVRREALRRRVRTTGRFEARDDARVAVSPKIGGWVERLYVDDEGARVRTGDPLLEIYSPDLVSTQEEYLLALRNVERLKDGPGASDAERLLRATERRLQYWDVSDDQIERLRKTGEPKKTMTLHAPASGTVTMKNVTEGQQTRAGETLLEMTNLARLWLMIDVYEQDLVWVDVGTQATIELPYAPGSTSQGRVDYLYDTLDPKTRTLTARIPVPNADRRLRPGMYATAVLEGGPIDAHPIVPSDAVIRTGEREVVIVALGDGRFRPVTVQTGVEAGDRVQVLDGLDGGEEVVTRAQFLIDSEARLTNALASMEGEHQH